ncbi:MAG: hypothetical protein ACR2MK_09875 [Solirubrobacteraceae bacterium]
MSNDDPQGPQGRAAGADELSDDALGRLEQRLDRASQAAERLIAEAAAAAEAGTRRPPPAGWQQADNEPGDDAGTRGRAGAAGEIEILLEAIHALRERIPPELQRRLGEALREVLLALRALIDWYLERTERRRREPAEVQDIPIA